MKSLVLIVLLLITSYTAVYVFFIPKQKWGFLVTQLEPYLWVMWLALAAGMYFL